MQKIIRIEWDGPFSLKDIGYSEEKEAYNLSSAKLNNEEIDFGLYQIYGYHPVYGNNVLLYIGQAFKQTFAKRLSQEEWEYDADFRNLQIYVGRLFSNKQPNDSKYQELVDYAEKILIYSHSPALNSSNILTVTRDKNKFKKFEQIRVLNYDSHRSLMPEVSGELWLKAFDDFDGVFKKKSKKR